MLQNAELSAFNRKSLKPAFFAIISLQIHVQASIRPKKRPEMTIMLNAVKYKPMMRKKSQNSGKSAEVSPKTAVIDLYQVDIIKVPSIYSKKGLQLENIRKNFLACFPIVFFQRRILICTLLLSISPLKPPSSQTSSNPIFCPETVNTSFSVCQAAK